MKIPSINTTFSPQEFYTLLALTDKTLHGYGIIDQVAHDSESTVVMAGGTIYPLLKRMISQGLVAKVDADGAQPQIVYRYELTNSGRACLVAEVGRIQRIADHARYKLSAQKRFRA